MRHQIPNSTRLKIIFVLMLIAFVMFIQIRFGHAQQLEITPDMEWKPHQSGVLVWHTESTVCIHATAGATLPKIHNHPDYVDHGNYVALRSGKYIYWVDKEPVKCSTNGVESKPIIEKTWICDVDCKAK